MTTKETNAQLIYQPYSYQFYQKLNKAEYTINTNAHTAVKPYFISDSSAVRRLYDSIVMAGADNSHKSWLHRIVFSGHAVDVKNGGYTLNADYLPDLVLGKQLEGGRTIWLNTRGYQVSGTVGSNFFFYTSGYENQGKFANYETDYINKTHMVPGQGYNRSLPAGSKDWAYVTALIGYQAGKNISIALGEDKTFIGEGYRSMLLSDYASACPLLRLTVNLGKKFRYMAMWTYMEDQNAVQFNSFSNNRRKWGVFHYIDWSITNRASLGFFNAVISEEANDEGKLRGFDMNYINPVYFSPALGPASQAADHTLIGFNGKYKILTKTIIYGQLLFDQSLSSAVKGNNNAWQAGLKGWDLFKVSNLNYLFEYNTASPFTYSNKYPIVNYAELNEPLADPLGANFKECIGILNYSLGKFDFQGELLWAKYGLNMGDINYGKDITLANDVNIAPGYSVTGQGLATTLKYAEGTVAYILNPKYNLRMEIGVLVRQESNALSNTKTILFTVGLRSSFRDLYHDF
ncbi:gliding motility protein RemB [Mucilaginibacter gotjawali]|uniref:gliding motility protein RemB n=1 Tax=Mucilaginibacter gotjawali TaxID=1550579 RepID=UPI0012FD6D6E|nr:gliding motility protein RemB [Mucilaginibacter gotjawali]